jgi:hypothetical protein
MINQGWQCPVCKRVYAPSVATCWNCPQQYQYGYGTNEPKTPRWNGNVSVRCAVLHPPGYVCNYGHE